MSSPRVPRVGDEPAYVLHRYEWSESSLILEVFTRHRGRVALAAKGARRPTSSFRPILLPMQALRIGYSGEGDVKTLKSAEWSAGHALPQGEALLSAYYANELLMRLLPRDDAHPELFDAYAQTISLLAHARDSANGAGLVGAALRAFELRLLRQLGLLPALDAETTTLTPLIPQRSYRLSAEGGLLQTSLGEDRAGLPGAAWLALEEGLADSKGGSHALVQTAGAQDAALRAQLRPVLLYHCGVQQFKTRQIIVDLQALQLPAARTTAANPAPE